MFLLLFQKLERFQLLIQQRFFITYYKKCNYFFVNIKLVEKTQVAKKSGSFTNYVHKTRWVGGQKFQLFVNVHKVENVNAGG